MKISLEPTVCKCGKDMRIVFVWDNDQEADFAFNVYACSTCGRIMKQDVGTDPGKFWIGLCTLEDEH